jgi:hypothetical protein
MQRSIDRAVEQTFSASILLGRRWPVIVLTTRDGA